MQMLLTQLRTLFDLIVDFQGKQEAMFDAFLAEAKLRKQFGALKTGRAEQVGREDMDGKNVESTYTTFFRENGV